MARSGLGRGLDVLLGERGAAGAPAQSLATGSGSVELPLEAITANRQQPRTHFDQAELDSLANSIRAHGVLQPIVVSRQGDSYELVAGHRRVLASRLAGKTSIPAVIREDVTDRLELALVENLQRADLNAIETARAYKLLQETYGLTQEEVAERLGKSRSSVANTMRALAAPQLLQDAVIDGKISEGHLRALMSLPLSQAVAALGDVIAKEMSVREVEALARKLARRRDKRDGRSTRGVDPELVPIVDRLRATLGTKVDVERRKRGGRITIEFYSNDDLDRLVDQLTGTRQ